MKKLLQYIFLLICILTGILVGAEAQGTWSRLYNFCPDTVNISNNITHYADDSFFIVAGNTKTDSISPQHIYIATIDYNGNVLHKKNLYFPGIINNITLTNGSSNFGTNHSLLKISANKYLLAGVEDNVHQTSFGLMNTSQPFLYFFDSNCDSFLFRKYTDTIISRTPYSILSDNQDNIVLTGIRTSKSLYFDPWDQKWYADTLYAWLAKYDKNGIELWSKDLFVNTNIGNLITNPVTAFDEGDKVILSHNGMSYLVAGITYNQNKKGSGVIIAKTDLSGNVLWQKFLPRPYITDNSIDIIPLKDGNYGFVSTYQYVDGYPFVSTFLYYGEFNENGDTVWTKTVFDVNFEQIEGKEIAEANNGELILLGFDINKRINFFYRTTSDGLIKSYRSYLYVDSLIPGLEQRFFSLSVTPQKQILLSGMLSSPAVIPGIFDSVGTFAWHLLTDTFGCLIPGCQLGDTVWPGFVPNLSGNIVSVYPNPVNNVLTINGIAKGTIIQLFDIRGRQVYCGIASKTFEEINTSSLPPGTYILQLSNEDGSRIMKKVMKE